MEYQSGAVSPIESISEGWNIIKDTYWVFFGMTLVAIIILFVIAMILGFINNLITYAIASIFGIAAQGVTGDVGDVAVASAAIVPQLISMFISIFTNIIVATVSGVLFCGLYSALSRKVNSGVAEFGDLFSGFDKIMPCLIVAVVLALVQFVIGVVSVFVGAAIGVGAFGLGSLITSDGQLNPAIFGGLLLVFLALFFVYLVISIIISALMTFVYPLIADRGLSGGEALLVSAKSGLSNLGGIIVMLILLGLMFLGGALLCFVGMLFVAPIYSAAIYAAFQRVFGRTGGGNYQYSPPPPPTSFGNQPGY